MSNDFLISWGQNIYQPVCQVASMVSLNAVRLQTKSMGRHVYSRRTMWRRQICLFASIAWVENVQLKWISCTCRGALQSNACWGPGGAGRGGAGRGATAESRHSLEDWSRAVYRPESSKFTFKLVGLKTWIYLHCRLSTCLKQRVTDCRVFRFCNADWRGTGLHEGGTGVSGECWLQTHRHSFACRYSLAYS